MNRRISQTEILHVNSKKLSCNGDKGGSGHPLIYLEMGKNDFVICPYCSRYFTTKPVASTSLKHQLKKNEQ